MIISAMRKRIIFQRHIVKADSIGNHINSWDNFYSCWASSKVKSASETEDAAQTLEQSKLIFTVRYCPKAAEITSTEYRIIFEGRIYGIETVDTTYKDSVKFTAVLERR